MHLFLDDALREIHSYSHGYPRKITMLCHRALKELVMKNRAVVDGAAIRKMIDEEIRSGWHKRDLILQKNSY